MDGTRVNPGRGEGWGSGVTSVRGVWGWYGKIWAHFEFLLAL